MDLRQKITKNLINLPGWRTNRKIVVIESDDWGSIRMPSINNLNRLLKKGVKFDLSIGYDKVDTIASGSDLKNLFEILSSVRDKNNNPAIITANSVVANPNFDKIKSSDFTEYHYELITDTMEKYYPQTNPFVLWQQGMKENVFHPQFHGREHLNAQLWIELLRNNPDNIRDSFNESVFSSIINILSDNRTHVLAAYDYKNAYEQAFIKDSIHDGLQIFERLFGYKSSSAIAPCYVWDDFIEACYHAEDVKYIQGSIFQSYPSCLKLQNNRKGKYHYCGEKNRFNQRYLVRNCFFEPSQNPDINFVDDCLDRIRIAFRWKKPAIISVHRLNFIGALDVQNRDKNLKLFSDLLKKIKKRWPDIEFMTSDQLGCLMK
jgi:hypothetical protein